MWHLKKLTAVDIVEHLNPDQPPDIYIKHLDSAYGTLQDGEELLNVNGGKNPSTYLQWLQVALSLAMKREGIPESE